MIPRSLRCVKASTTQFAPTCIARPALRVAAVRTSTKRPRRLPTTASISTSSHSQANNLLSGRPSSSSFDSDILTQSAWALKQAVAQQDSYRIRRRYVEFREDFISAGEEAERIIRPVLPPTGRWSKWTRSRNSDPSITPGILHDAIEILSGARSQANTMPRIEEVKVAAEIIRDMHTLYGMQSVLPLHSIVVKGMARADPHAALDWLLQIDDSGSDSTLYTVTLDDYVAVMTGFASRKNELGMLSVIDRIRHHSSLRPTAALWHPYILFLFSSSPSSKRNIHRVNETLRVMEAENIQLTPRLLSDIVIQFSLARAIDSATRYAEALRGEIEPDSVTVTPSELSYACAALVRVAGMNGYPAGLQEALLLREAGFVLNSSTMRTLLDLEDVPSFDSQSLVELANKLDVSIAPQVWTVVIRKTLKEGSEEALEKALTIYNESKLRNTVPNAGLVDPLIYALCNRTSPPNAKDVDLALDIYYDLRDAHESQRPSGNLASRHKPPDDAIFIMLLRAVVRSRPPSEDTSDLVIQLLIDMRYFKVKLETSFVQSVLTELLGASDSHDTAFKIWNYIREIDQSILTKTGYEEVLNQFANLSFEDAPLPSLSHYLDIMQNMRNAGTPMTSFVYTVIFDRYAKLARSISDQITAAEKNGDDVDLPDIHAAQDHREKILEALKRLHLALKIDASFTPTTAVFNALMNAYNHLGEYQEAFNVWSEMAYGTPPFDHISVNIVLDMCGYAEDITSADSVWRRVKSAQVKPRAGHPPFQTTVNNWTSLIECRARCGKYESAFNAFKDMVHAKDRATTPAPDRKCMEVMLKFAEQHGDGERVRELIRSSKTLRELLDQVHVIPSSIWNKSSDDQARRASA